MAAAQAADARAVLMPATAIYCAALQQLESKSCAKIPAGEWVVRARILRPVLGAKSRLERASKQRAMLQVLEAESLAAILQEEGRERERVLWEAAGAKRQREMDIWETRCRAALLRVYWERVEATGGQ